MRPAGRGLATADLEHGAKHTQGQRSSTSIGQNNLGTGHELFSQRPFVELCKFWGRLTGKLWASLTYHLGWNLKEIWHHCPIV